MEKNKFYCLLFMWIILGCGSTALAGMPNSASRKAHVESHPNLSSEIKQAIIKGKVIEGMTKEDVLATWGEPTEKYKYSEHKRAIDENDFITHDEFWSYKPPFFSFKPKKFVRFNIYGIANYVSVDYK